MVYSSIGMPLATTSLLASLAIILAIQVVTGCISSVSRWTWMIGWWDFRLILAWRMWIMWIKMDCGGIERLHRGSTWGCLRPFSLSNIEFYLEFQYILPTNPKGRVDRLRWFHIRLITLINHYLESLTSCKRKVSSMNIQRKNVQYKVIRGYMRKVLQSYQSSRCNSCSMMFPSFNCCELDRTMTAFGPLPDSFGR